MTTLKEIMECIKNFCDDAANAQLFNVHELPVELAFDHMEIIEDWLSSRPEEGSP